MNDKTIPINDNNSIDPLDCENDQVLDSQNDATEITLDADQKTLEILEKAQKEASEYRDTLQRLKAEFDNFRKRMAKERCRLTDIHQAVVLEAILPALDSFDAALNSPEIDETNEVFQGLKLIYDVLMQNLEKLGFHKMDLLNTDFDPEKSEALMVQQTDTVEPGIVIAEISAGYMFRKSILRPARVVVSCTPEVSEEEKIAHKNHKTGRKEK